MRARDCLRGTERAHRACFIAATAIACGYLALEHEALVRRVGAATPLDLAAGALAVLVVLELARRATGYGLVAVALLAILYAFTGRTCRASWRIAGTRRAG